MSSTGSFNAAAKQLYISVPGLVKAMDRLKTSWAFSLCAQAFGRDADRRGRRWRVCAALHPQIRDGVSNKGGGTAGDARRMHDVGHAGFFPRNFLSRFVPPTRICR
ncbi:MAG: hypothetical protein ACLS7Z_03775 [Christensenellales bacterium]